MCVWSSARLEKHILAVIVVKATSFKVIELSIMAISVSPTRNPAFPRPPHYRWSRGGATSPQLDYLVLAYSEAICEGMEAIG